MPPNDSGFFETSFARLKSPTFHRPSRFSLPNAEAFSRLAHQFTQRVDKPTSSSPRFSAKSKKPSPVYSSKAVTKSKITILHAVPETQSIHTVDAIPGSGRASPASPASDNYNLSNTRLRTASDPIRSGMEPSPSAHASSQGVIGIYQNGTIQWDSASRSSSAARGQRLGLTVDIPTGKTNEKPLPKSPFFVNPAGTHIRSASDESLKVSPPFGSQQYMMRDSMVSPLTAQHIQPTQSFIPTIDSQIAKPEFGSPDLSNGVNSSDEYRDDDASSTYSVQSSATSAGAEASTPHKPMHTHVSVSTPGSVSVSSPKGTGIWPSPPRDSMKSAVRETGHRVQGSMSPPHPTRNYPRHPFMDIYQEFIPTCALHPSRNASDTPRRPLSTQPALAQQRNERPVSIRPDHEMGIITQVTNRPVQRTLPLGIPSPTWSEAENELEQELTFSADDNPFKWDDIVNLEDIVPLHDIIPEDDFRISHDGPVSPQGIGRKDSITYAMPVYAPPPRVPRVPKIPMKSNKRRFTPMGADGFRLSHVPVDHIASQMKRGHSKGLSIAVPENRRMTTDDFILSPLPIPLQEWRANREITPEVAEGVILNIFQSLESLDDLFSCAVINRGFYRVFKRNELDLMKTVLRKMSPPAWEYREICYPGHDAVDEEELDRPRQDYTAASYIRDFSHDMYIISEIKLLIKEKCQSFLRPEIAAAIDSEDPVESARVDDALWRIGSFCKIFGSRKGRNDDVTAQMDWLQGGILVHQKACTSSAPMWDDMNETLASAPECFAKGNEGGLTAEQLFDTMELWNCLGVLLQKIEGRAIQARSYGIFDKTDIRGGDVDGEEMMLDEWYYWLLTQGLATVLELTGPCQKTDSSVFHVAAQRGLDNWEPPAPGGTRRNFLKEAASRVYEDRIAQVYAESSTKEVQRAMSKQRIQRHINEIRTRKNSSERPPEIRMSQDRPMDEWEDGMGNLMSPRSRTHRKSVNNLVTHIPSLTSVRYVSATSNIGQEIAVSLSRTPSPPHSPPRRTVAMPLLPSPPPSTVPSVRDRSSTVSSSLPALDEHPAFRRQETIPEMPPLAEHPMYAFPDHLQQRSPGSSIRSSESSSSRAAFQQHPFQRSMHENGAAENTAERAIHRIVEMGFTPEQARLALRMTDGGDGLRVDRAVELLLRDMAL
ncbi:hypothetical protein P280DRAFT_474158 [Massarina eburnea CBS 473.64]|uniref:UBA domain-containing protein n=1 Tax=Massarina eburnea CBS 473.64 TaxID=1395130 RepID=A0A6A6RIE5_9PLEO|nr:hypothetical protein P280DRAFT_474158 [Massarina eburnea CBS 473.64]